MIISKDKPFKIADVGLKSSKNKKHKTGIKMLTKRQKYATITCIAKLKSEIINVVLYE